MNSLRELLFKLAGQFRSLPPQQQLDKKLNAEFLEMLMAVHYQNMMYTCRSVDIVLLIPLSSCRNDGNSLIQVV